MDSYICYLAAADNDDCDNNKNNKNNINTRLWANAQRDGRPAFCRWRPLFNAAKFGGRRRLLECRAETLLRLETR